MQKNKTVLINASEMEDTVLKVSQSVQWSVQQQQRKNNYVSSYSTMMMAY